MLKVLIACEESQTVLAEFLGVGIQAYSCDTQPCSGNFPQYHIQRDVLDILHFDWDMIIAFPPCTHLAVSGAAHFKKKILDGRQQEGIDFFMSFVNADCKKIAVENPIGIMSSVYRKPDQIIQPWQFGHLESKATCLWLKGLPLLKETLNLYNDYKRFPKRLQQHLHNLPPSKDRAKIRSKTFKGIAKAMAEQWGSILKQELNKGN